MEKYITYQSKNYCSDLEVAKKFLFGYGSNYALATSLFPKQAQEDTIIFYAFVRYADELVDNPLQEIPHQGHRNIEEYIMEWKVLIKNVPDQTTHPILRAAYWFFKKNNIPFQYSLDFLNAMYQDISKDRYQNYRELQGYMWGSASVIGHVMTYVLGYNSAYAFTSAQALGEAMQLSNFLRDIDDDYQSRKRIYLPQVDMKAFGVGEEDIKKRIMTDELRNLIKFYVEKTKALYIEGRSGITLLSSGRFPVLFALHRYRYYLTMIEKNDYNIFIPLKINKRREGLLFISSFFDYLRLSIQKML